MDANSIFHSAATIPPFSQSQLVICPRCRQGLVLFHDTTRRPVGLAGFLGAFSGLLSVVGMSAQGYGLELGGGAVALHTAPPYSTLEMAAGSVAIGLVVFGISLAVFRRQKKVAECRYCGARWG